MSSFESESFSSTSRDEQDVTDTSQTGIGLSDPHLFQRERIMLDLINRMHNTGVQVDMDLPQIAVIGQQSAGKSSVIEAISGITLPRSSGTCTRCPTECRLSSSQSPWQCVVSLRFTSNSQPQVRNEDFGPIIYDKAEVEDRIRRAQRAILNPSKPSKQFLEDTEDIQDSELSFSSNCVSLQISGPDVADLSFCDLPGLIATVSSSRRGGGGNNDIGLVESLVASYIKKPSCIILLTVTCETDFENQGANRLTKLHDPEGKRTVGVLTKPDRIPSGETGNWLSFIRNEKEHLTNGWYAVKQPGSQAIEKGITWAEAREQEDTFFASESGWCDLDPIYHKYLRTTNLVARLSEILSDLISKRLPEIQNELDKTIYETRERLNKLPKAPSSDPVNDICTLIYTFTTDLARHVEGVADKDGLLQAIRPAHEKFRQAIRSTAPNFQPFEEKQKAKRRLTLPSFLLNEEVDDTTGSDTKDENDPIYIDEVMERAYQARTRELPDHYPFVVNKTFIDAVIRKWNTPAMDLCKTVHKVTSEHVQKLVKQHFGSFGQGYLEQRVMGMMQQHVTQCLDHAEERVSWLLALEDRPFTMNNHYLSDYRNKFLAHYRGARELHHQPDVMRTIQSFSSTQAARAYQYNNGQPTGVAKVIASLAEMGMGGVKAEDLAKLFPPDKMEPALEIMADVRAYFQVAYKRFADNIPLAIDLELVRGLEYGIHSALCLHVGVSGPNATSVCQKLAGEFPAVARDRADLLKKMERLESASKELLYFGV